MSSGSSTSSSLAALQARVAELVAQKASLTRIAVQSVRLLQAQDEDERPEGMWLRQGDSELLDAIQDGEVELGDGRPWEFAKVSLFLAAGRASVCLKPPCLQ
jgi:hypothetical protein